MARTALEGWAFVLVGKVYPWGLQEALSIYPLRDYLCRFSSLHSSWTHTHTQYVAVRSVRWTMRRILDRSLDS